MNIFHRFLNYMIHIYLENHMSICKSYIVKDVGMRNEASPESVPPVIRPVIHPLSIRPVVHAIDTLEAPRLPAAHHPSESDTAAFCPPRMGRK